VSWPAWRAAISAGLIGLAVFSGHGCANQARERVLPLLTTEHTPASEPVAPGELWRQAQAYAETHPGSEIFVGSGGSMLPLYQDRTVLIVRAMKLDQLKRGMTVVYIGDSGRLVAHTLLQESPRGWTAMGVGNRAPDRTPVRYRNYIGTVIKAFRPDAGWAAPVVILPVNPRGGIAAAN
jgi:hypothetical protein